MNKSRQEEIISALWIIAAVLSFGFGFKIYGWIFAVKGLSDALCSIWCAIQEVAIKRRDRWIK